MATFDNTEIAFRRMSDFDLKRAYWLFQALHCNSFVSLGKLGSSVAVALHLPISPFIRHTVYRHFCGGDNIVQCRKTIAQLAQYRIGTILDYAVEGNQSEASYEAATQEILATIQEAKINKSIPFCVFKMTGVCRLGILEKASQNSPLAPQEIQELSNIKGRVKRLCEAARDAQVPIMIDAEESWIQKAIDTITEEMMQQYNTQQAVVYHTIQMYRHDRLPYYKALVARAQADGYHIGMKLVRGAYMEKERQRAAQLGYPSPIYNTKDETDQAYNDALTFSVQNCQRVAICAGTHNEQSCLHLTELLAKHGLANDRRIYFSQLLGMSDHLSYNLAHDGYNVAKYVPYGPVTKVLPYLIRRAEENTAVRGQMGRELKLILQEQRRRAQTRTR